MKPEHIPHILNIAYGGLLRTTTPEDVANHLEKAGYVKKAIGGLVPTQSAYDYLIQNDHHPTSPQG